MISVEGCSSPSHSITAKECSSVPKHATVSKGGVSFPSPVLPAVDNSGQESTRSHTRAEVGPSLQGPSNYHPIQTRLKSGILKPKMFSTELHEREPITIEEAFKSEAWNKAA